MDRDAERVLDALPSLSLPPVEQDSSGSEADAERERVVSLIDSLPDHRINELLAIIEPWGHR